MERHNKLHTRLPIPKMGFAPRKLNISANKIVIYAAVALGQGAFRRYSGSLASKSAVKTVRCSSLSFKNSFLLIITKCSCKRQCRSIRAKFFSFLNAKRYILCVNGIFIGNRHKKLQTWYTSFFVPNLMPVTFHLIIAKRIANIRFDIRKYLSAFER